MTCGENSTLHSQDSPLGFNSVISTEIKLKHYRHCHVANLLRSFEF